MLLVRVSSIWFGGVETFWYKTSCIKTWKFGQFFLNDFLDLKWLDTTRSKLLNPLDQNLLIVLVSNIYNGNMRPYRPIKLCMKT